MKRNNKIDKIVSCLALYILINKRKFVSIFFFLWLYSPIQTVAASMKLSVSLQFLDLGQSVGLLGRVISSSQGLSTCTQTQKMHTQHKHETSMPRVGFEATVPESERAKTVHALDRSATVTDSVSILPEINLSKTNYVKKQMNVAWNVRPTDTYHIFLDILHLIWVQCVYLHLPVKYEFRLTKRLAYQISWHAVFSCANLLSLEPSMENR
jgi:hypothetical protein